MGRRTALVGVCAVALALLLWLAWLASRRPSRATLDLPGGSRIPGESATSAPHPVAEATGQQRGARESAPQAVAQIGAAQGRGSLTVEVTFADGSPTSGSHVYLVEPWTSAPFSERTDDEGRAVFTDLAPGKKWVEGDRGGHAEADVIAGRMNHAQLVVPLGVSLTVHVQDEAQVPVAGASVFLSSQQGQLDGEQIGVTDSGGDFRLASAQPARLLWVTAQGFEPSHSHPIFEQENATVLTVAMKRGGGCVSGRISDATNGQPLDRAVVMIRGFSTPSFAEFQNGHTYMLGKVPPIKVVTGADGLFSSCVVPSNASSVEVMRAGYVGVVKDGWEGRLASGWVELGMEPAATLDGVVRFEDGSGAEGAVVRLTRQEESDRLALRLRTVSSADGTFTLFGVPTGLQRLSASLGPGFVGESMVNAGTDVSPTEIVLSSRTAVRIVARDGNGVPLADCCISLLGEPGERTGTRYTQISTIGMTDQDGQLLVQPRLLREGDGRVGLLLGYCGNAFPLAVENWDDGMNTLTFTVTEPPPYAGALELVLSSDIQNEEVACSVFVRDDALGEWTGIRLSSLSTERLGGLRPGSYTCVTIREGTQRALGQFDVSVGTTTRAEFRWEDIGDLPASTLLSVGSR